MPRSAAIRQLTAAFEAAGLAQDWDRVGLLAQALAPQLTALKARALWSAAELTELARLRAVHDRILAACGEVLAELGEHLADMCNNKDGWIAYALASENEAAGQHE